MTRPWHFDLFSLKAVLASFPSGHTISVFGRCASLSFFVPPKWSAAVFLRWRCRFAASRLIIGAHYPSGRAGWGFIGLGSALAVARVFRDGRSPSTLEGDAVLPEPRGNVL